MAEFCFECYKRYIDKCAKIENLVMDKNLDLCEGCGQYKFTVIKTRELYLLDLFKHWFN